MYCKDCGHQMEEKYFCAIPNRGMACFINFCWSCGNKAWSYNWAGETVHSGPAT